MPLLFCLEASAKLVFHSCRTMKEQYHCRFQNLLPLCSDTKPLSQAKTPFLPQLLNHALWQSKPRHHSSNKRNQYRIPLRNCNRPLTNEFLQLFCKSQQLGKSPRLKLGNLIDMHFSEIERANVLKSKISLVITFAMVLW